MGVLQGLDVTVSTVCMWLLHGRCLSVKGRLASQAMNQKPPDAATLRRWLSRACLACRQDGGWKE